MRSHFTVACLSLALGAVVAGAQTTHHYEAGDAAPADEAEDQQAAPQAVQAPAPAKRAALRVFQVTRPGVTHAEPNVETQTSGSGSAIAGEGQSLGGQGMGIQRVLETKPLTRTADESQDGGKGNAASAGAKCEMRKILRPLPGENEHPEITPRVRETIPPLGM